MRTCWLVLLVDSLMITIGKPIFGLHSPPKKLLSGVSARTRLIANNQCRMSQLDSCICNGTWWCSSTRKLHSYSRGFRVIKQQLLPRRKKRENGSQTRMPVISSQVICLACSHADDTLDRGTVKVKSEIQSQQKTGESRLNFNPGNCLVFAPPLNVEMHFYKNWRTYEPS